MVEHAGGTLRAVADIIKGALTDVGDFKSGDAVLDLCEPWIGMWSAGCGGMGRVLGANESWYSGIGCRIALNHRAGRPPQSVSDSATDWTRELNECADALGHILAKHRFGKLRRKWSVTFTEFASVITDVEEWASYFREVVIDRTAFSAIECLSSLRC